MNESRLKGRTSRIHHGHVKDFLISIVSSERKPRWSGAVRRPTAPASNTIHLRGGFRRSRPMLLVFPPPLHSLQPGLSCFEEQCTYMSECVPANQTSMVCGCSPVDSFLTCNLSGRSISFVGGSLPSSSSSSLSGDP